MTEEPPPELLQGLAGLPEGQLREAAFCSYASGLAASDPALAARWAQGIAQADLRTRALEQVAGVWLKADPTGARAWIEQGALPPESQARVLSRKKR